MSAVSKRAYFFSDLEATALAVALLMWLDEHGPSARDGGASYRDVDRAVTSFQAQMGGYSAKRRLVAVREDGYEVGAPLPEPPAD